MDPAYEEASALSMEVEVAKRKPVRKTFAKRDQVAAELVAFAECIRSGREPEPSGEEGLADLRVLEAIQRAIRSGRREKVDAVQRRARPSKSQAIERKPHGMPPLVHAEPPGRD
jgi:glucose-fructose oxidoreductase